MRRALPLVALLACGPGPKDSPALIGAGAVIVDAKTNKVRLDVSRVPVIPSCGPGQYVRRDVAGMGWECAPPEVPWDAVTEKPAQFPPADHWHKDLMARIAALEARLEESEKRLDYGHTELTDARTALADTRQRLSAAEAELAKSKKQLDQMEQRMAGLRKFISSRPAAQAKK